MSADVRHDRLSAQVLNEVRLRRLQRGRQPGEHPGCDRDRERKGQDAQIDVHVE